VISAQWTLVGVLLQSEDLLPAAVAVGWTVLRLGLGRVVRGR